MKLHLPKASPALHLPHYGERPKPFRDWSVLMTIAATLFFASLAWNIWFFIQATQGEVGENTNSIVTPPKTNVIESARAYLAERAEEAGRYRSGYRFTDPSVGSGGAATVSTSTSTATTTDTP